VRKDLMALAFTAGSLIANSAIAAELRTIRSAADATIYIESDTIRRSSGKSAVWTVWDHAKEHVNLHEEPYRSARLLNEYDCAARTVRLIEIVEYVEPLGSGPSLRSYPGDDLDPRPVSPGSVADEILNEVCSPAVPAALKSF
jgi:Surface-adhesin protein E